MAKLISKTYGDALFDIAMESGKLDEYMEEVSTLSALLAENYDLVRLMNHPEIVKEEKIDVLEKCFAENLSKEMVGFLELIVQKDRFGDIDDIFTYFIARGKEYQNIGTAVVTSAVELREEQKRAVEEKLLATTRYVKFEIDYQVDASLLGGMVIRIGDRVVDSSVKTKIRMLSKDLSKIQLKAGECAP